MALVTAKYIAMEGIDISGKSTQLTRTRNYLSAYCDPSKFVFLKEPNTEHPSGKEIYQLLTRTHPTLKLSEMHHWVMQARYFRNRIWHYKNRVLPALAKGLNVISDRSWASISYGVNSPDEFEPLLAIEQQAFEGADVPFVKPDRILIFDVTAEIAKERMERSGKEPDEFEKDLDFQMRVRENYLEFARMYPNCVIIDGSGTPEEVFKETKKVILEVFGL